MFSFENGNVGVNFLGYHASAGLGGLLTGNAAQGGLHAQAGTPHGQIAGAGLGGGVDGSGNASGFSYHFGKGFGPLDILPLLRRRIPQTTEAPEELPETTLTPEKSAVETFDQSLIVYGGPVGRLLKPATYVSVLVVQNVMKI